MKNFFKFRDYSKISALDDLEYLSGCNFYNVPIISNKNDDNNQYSLLNYKYANKNGNLTFNNSTDKENLRNHNTINTIERSQKLLNFQKINRDIGIKVSNISDLIDREKSKNNFLENKKKYISGKDDTKNFIKNQKEMVYDSSVKSCKSRIIKKNEDSYNTNNKLNESKRNNNEFDTKLDKTNDSPLNNNEENKTQNVLMENVNFKRNFSSSMLDFKTVEDIKNNIYGIKLNLEEEIFLQFLIDIVQLNKESEIIKNELARKIDFSIIKIFKIFKEYENDIELFNQEKSFVKSNLGSTLSNLNDLVNYSNTFNIMERFNNTSKSFLHRDKSQNHNTSYIKIFPIKSKTKENLINKFAFKTTLNEMEIYPTLLELRLIFNRYNNKEHDFR